MKKVTNIIVALLFLIILNGCANSYPVTFDSYPQGATLIGNGTNYGYTPVTLYFDSSVKDKAALSISHFSANWASGARTNYGIIPVKHFPNGVTQTVQRPSVPGLAQDNDFALRVQHMRAAQQQAAAAHRQADAAEDLASAAQSQAMAAHNTNMILNNQLQQINNNLRRGSTQQIYIMPNTGIPRWIPVMPR